MAYISRRREENAIELYLKKYHGFGNDYLIFDPNRSKAILPPEQVQLICNRNFGVGSDGILAGPLLTDAGIRVEIYNPDGSCAEQSGNGILIFAKYLRDAGYVTGRFAEILVGPEKVRVEYCGDAAENMCVNMGRASFWSNEIPVRGPRREVVDEAVQLCGTTYWVSCLRIGNPHCVIPVPVVCAELVQRLGRSIEHAPQFPKPINLCLMQVQARDTLAVEVYERGAGYTLSSGSACCAAVAVGLRLGLTDRRVTVQMPGGTVAVQAAQDGTLQLAGSVHAICEMSLAPEFLEYMLSL